MTADELYLQVRAWLALAGASGGLTGAQVIKADQAGPRPTPPYATIKIIMHDQLLGEDEELVDGDELTTRGGRLGTASVNTFGIEAANWLQRATQMLRHQAVKATLTDVSITPMAGGANNLSQLVEDRMEMRFQRDFRLQYASTSDPEAVIELDSVETEHEIGNLTFTYTETL